MGKRHARKARGGRGRRDNQTWGRSDAREGGSWPLRLHRALQLHCPARMGCICCLQMRFKAILGCVKHGRRPAAPGGPTRRSPGLDLGSRRSSRPVLHAVTPPPHAGTSRQNIEARAPCHVLLPQHSLICGCQTNQGAAPRHACTRTLSLLGPTAALPAPPTLVSMVHVMTHGPLPRSSPVPLDPAPHAQVLLCIPTASGNA